MTVHLNQRYKPTLTGLGLPTDADGVVRDQYFMRCYFHESVRFTKFERCVFCDCEGDQFIRLMSECRQINYADAIR